MLSYFSFIFSPRVKTVVTVGAASLLVGVLASANWTPPPATPPTCPSSNPACNPPIHTGNQAQNKEGTLTLGAFGGPGGLLVLNGKVGIGTPSPASKFALVDNPFWAKIGADVYQNAISGISIGGSDSYAVGITIENNGGPHTGIVLDEPDSSNASLFRYDNNTNELGIISAGKVRINADGYSGPSSDVRIQDWTNPLTGRPGNVLLAINGGRVGVGTASPAQKLDVVGGQIHATGDICTDAGGGQCLSSAGGGVTPSIVMATRGVSCVSDTNEYSGTVSCPAGTILLNCGVDETEGAPWTHTDAAAKLPSGPTAYWTSRAKDGSNSCQFRIRTGESDFCNPGPPSHWTLRAFCLKLD